MPEPPISVHVKTEVPSNSAARTVDALTDIIRPISETLGLLGDRISLRRQATLNKISAEARRRVLEIEKPIHEVPGKFFVPLIEKAILEDVDDDKIIDMWANLLATAATDNVQMLGQYIGILSEVTSPQVNIFEDIIRVDAGEIELKAGTRKICVDDFVDSYYFYNQTGLPALLDKFSSIDDIDAFSERIIDELDTLGLSIDCVNVFRVDTDSESRSLGSPDGVYSDSLYFDFQNLCRIGLLNKIEIKNHKTGNFDVDVHYYIVTPVGADLYACCNPTKLIR